MHIHVFMNGAKKMELGHRFLSHAESYNEYYTL